MIFFDNKISADAEKVIEFTAYENDVDEGRCILDLSSQYAHLTFACYNEGKPYIAEGLVRAAFNYAANKGFYMGMCSCESIYSVLEKMNFEKENGAYVNDIPSILMGKCCCDNKSLID